MPLAPLPQANVEHKSKSRSLLGSKKELGQGKQLYCILHRANY
nr:unnamed protein product [Digitaria exilis]